MPEYKPGQIVQYRYVVRDDGTEGWYYGICIGVEDDNVQLIDESMQEYTRTPDRLKPVRCADDIPDNKPDFKKMAKFVESLLIRK